MRIVTYDELPDRSEPSRALLHLAAFRGIFSRTQVETIRRGVGTLAPYVGLFALDGSTVVGQTFVLRIPYAFPGGEGTIGGIAGVGTRPDRGSRGVARSILEAVHERERADGVSYTALWTNRSWGAHRLYESLGYRDVYSPPWALFPGLRAGRRRLARPPGVRRGRSRDLEELDRVHNRFGEGRWGFARRPGRFFWTEKRLGGFKPEESLLVAERGGRPAGYAVFEKGHGRLFCGELVAPDRASERRLFQGLCAFAGKFPVVFQNTPATEVAPRLSSVRPTYLPTSWYGMMGASLRAPGWTARDARRKFATDQTRFLCLGGDWF